MSVSFTTRVPSTKVAVSVVQAGVVPADNGLVLIGRMAASGSTATADAPYIVQNYGDPIAAAAECATAFGASSEIGAMVVAAIKANAQSGKQDIIYPPITAIPMANGSSALATTLAKNLTLPMPFVASAFPASSSTQLTDFKTHLAAISASDRGMYGQFGSFGFVATDEDTSAASTEGTTAATENLNIAWLRDLAVGKANKTFEVAAALAAACAANGEPFLPMTDQKIGGLVAPSSSSDWHTPGDTGTVALGLAAGVVPLTVAKDGSIHVSRTVTTRRTLVGSPDSAYYDLQDWQTLYFVRKNVYALAQEDQYTIARASDEKLKSLRSDTIKMLHDFQDVKMLQHVEELASQIVLARVSGNRNAVVMALPLNVVPGLYQKGFDLQGTTQFDSLVIS